jgi:HNH endonuclease
VKRCTKCGEEKPITAFHHDRSTRDGLKAWCQACVKALRQAKRGPLPRDIANQLWEQGLKTCRRCTQTLPLEAFHQDRNRPHGLAGWCKACVKAYDDARALNYPIPDPAQLPELKRCRTCQIEQPLTNFHKRRQSPDGLYNQCIACRAIYDAARYDADPEKILLWSHNWKIAHPEHIRDYEAGRPEQRRAIQQRYWAKPSSKAKRRKAEAKRRAENPEYFRAKHRLRYQRYPLLFFAAAERRRALIKGAEVVETFTRMDIYRRDEGICHLCHLNVAVKDMSIDHLIPVSDKVYFSKAGHTGLNVALAHQLCNNKRNKGYIPAQLRLFGWYPEPGQEGSHA